MGHVVPAAHVCAFWVWACGEGLEELLFLFVSGEVAFFLVRQFRVSDFMFVVFTSEFVVEKFVKHAPEAADGGVVFGCNACEVCFGESEAFACQVPS